MRWLAAFGSVRSKLFAAGLVTSLVALVVAGASLFAYDLYTYRESSATNLAIEARLIGHASTAALEFDDRSVAVANLAFLRARPGVRIASLYGPDGALFALYARPGITAGEAPAGPGAEGVAIVEGQVRVFHPVRVGRELVGTVYLAEDLDVDQRVASYAVIAMAVLLAAMAVSGLVSALLQRSIARPIIRISELAHEVVEKRDYSVRATRTTDDEVGRLVDAFNEMLVQIEHRTGELESANAEVVRLNQGLEQRVGERTAQLEESNLRLRTASQAKSSFLSMMSHEIRTPMNGVLGMIELLSLTDLDAGQRTTLEIVRHSGRSLLRIIDDILDFSKIEAGRLEVNPEPCSIARVVESVVGVYSGNASSKGLVLKAYVDPRISPAVQVDPLRLQQILNNLVSNALKFTAKGAVDLRAELVESRDGVDVVSIAVTDTGVGISPESQAALFQPFAQVSGQAVRAYGGTGLGLSISRRLAELMGGSIAMTSYPGRGTTVTLRLPLPVADPAQLPVEGTEGGSPGLDAMVRARRAAPSVPQAEAEGSLVLVVDDHPINRMLLTRQVSVLGFAFEAAGDGLEALALWESGRFALILTDCNMPEMDGYALARRVREREATTGRSRTPIIACTANALAGEAQNCFDAGMDDYIAKPVDLPRLAAKLDHWLGTRGVRSGEPGAAHAQGGAVIDREVLRQAVGDDEALEREVLVQFASVNATDLLALERAFGQRDLDAVRASAHRIKGASRSVGATWLAEAAARLESAALAGAWDESVAAMDGVRRELERVGAAVDAMVAVARGAGG